MESGPRFKVSSERLEKPRIKPTDLAPFSCSTQLSIKFKLLINIEIVTISGKFRLKSKNPVIYPANKCLNANSYWHSNIYEQDKFKC